MNRITISETNEYGERLNLGWFDLDATTVALTEGARWNGENRIGIISKLQTNRAVLYRTKGGRWVEHIDASSEFNGRDRWRFITDTEARDWIMRSEGDGADDVLAEYFSEIPDESGPNLGGRPAVGPKVETRLDEETLAKVDARAAEQDVSRAEMLRRLIVAAL